MEKCKHNFETVVEYQGINVLQCITCSTYNLVEYKSDSDELYDSPQPHCLKVREEQEKCLATVLQYLKENAPAQKYNYFEGEVANKKWWSFQVQKKKETTREYLLLKFRDFGGEKREERKTDFTTRSFGNVNKYPNLPAFLEAVGLYHVWGMVYRYVRNIARAVGEEC